MPSLAKSGIGTANFATMRFLEEPDIPAEHAEVITRGNFDGAAIRLLGKRGTTYRVECKTDVLTPSARDVFRQLLADLKQQYCTLIDGQSVTHTNQVLRAFSIREQDIQTPVGGLNDTSSTIMLTTVLTLQDLGAS